MGPRTRFCIDWEASIFRYPIRLRSRSDRHGRCIVISSGMVAASRFEFLNPSPAARWYDRNWGKRHPVRCRGPGIRTLRTYRRYHHHRLGRCRGRTHSRCPVRSFYHHSYGFISISIREVETIVWGTTPLFSVVSRTGWKGGPEPCLSDQGHVIGISPFQFTLLRL